MEAKEVIEFLGFKPEEVKGIDDLKSKFDSEFVRAKNLTEDSELVKPLLGKVYGTLENELKKIAKPYEIDVEDEDFKNAKKVSEKFKILTTKVTSKLGEEIESLKGQVGQGNDEKVKELTVKLEKEKQKQKELNDLLNNTKSTLEQTENKYKGELKSIKLNTVKEQALSKVKFKQGITDIEREGYLSLINKNYIIDEDEDGSVVVKDTKGVRIQSGKVAGTFKTLDEVLEEEAVKAKLFELNPSKTPTKVIFAPKGEEQKKPIRQVAKPLNIM